MDFLLNKYYAIVLSKNEKVPDIATKLNLEENPLSSFSGYSGNRISGAKPQISGEIVWTWRKNLLRVRFFQIYGNNRQLIPINPDKFKPKLNTP